MTNRIRACLPAAMLRHAAVLVVATATMTGSLALPAFADNDRDDQNRGWNQSHRQQDRQLTLQQERQRAWQQERQRAWQQARWREAHRYDGYYRQPDVYYNAPPVVYQPPGYYQQPGTSLNFNFPFH